MTNPSQSSEWLDRILVFKKPSEGISEARPRWKKAILQKLKEAGVEARINEIEQADERNQYNPSCQGCYNNVSGNADRIEELRSELDSSRPQTKVPLSDIASPNPSPEARKAVKQAVEDSIEDQNNMRPQAKEKE